MFRKELLLNIYSELKKKQYLLERKKSFLIAFCDIGCFIWNRKRETKCFLEKIWEMYFRINVGYNFYLEKKLTNNID